MISYRIISKRLPQNIRNNNPEHAVPDNEDGKLKIYRRSYRVAQKIFKPGTEIRVVGTSVIGKILEIYPDFNDVKWDNGRPYFIVVEISKDNEIKKLLATPSQLRRNK